MRITRRMVAASRYAISKPKDMNKAVFEHAEKRIQYHLVEAMAHYQTAVRSDGTRLKKLKAWPTGASLQVGRSKIKGMDGAHSRVGRLVTNLKSRYIRDIITKGVVSPKKRETLSRARNMTPAVFDLLEKNHKNKAFVKSTFKQYWPTGSLVEGTELQYRIDSTVVVPRLVNRMIDKKAEIKVYDKKAKWLKRVCLGKMTPRQSADRLAQNLQSHFIKQINAAEEELKTAKSTAKIKRLNEIIHYTQIELNGTTEISDETFALLQNPGGNIFQ